MDRYYSHIELLLNDQLSNCFVTLRLPVLVMRRLWASDTTNDFVITFSLLAQIGGKLAASASCLMCANACVLYSVCVRLYS